MMPHPNLVRSPLFYKTDSHPINKSSNSDSGKPHAPPHDQLTFNADMSTSVKPFAGTETPVKLGGTLYLKSGVLSEEGESATHRFDCNTVGPVPVASGYGSRTLTHSAGANPN